jgi:DNA adenine methylase
MRREVILINKLKPILRWAGGKRQLLPELKKRMPREYNWYFEPFLGAGALFFELQPEKAVINDVNPELINLYQVIRDDPKTLLYWLETLPNDENQYYIIRSWERGETWCGVSPGLKAARTLYLNKTCFNGIYRLNKKGQFNTPYGKHKHDPDWEPELIYSISAYLNKSLVNIYSTDFVDVVSTANEKDFIYFDPPYDPLTETANFTAYTVGDFNRSDQLRLYETFVNLTNRGVKCMLSNANTPFIMHLYRDFKIEEIAARRSINSNGAARGLSVCEVIITNYEV